MKFASIVITHHAMNNQRSQMMRMSIDSLLENTKYPAEIIVVDNGGSDSDTEYLLQFNRQGLIHTYIRNSDNMHFGYARNQGLAMAQGDCLVVADNDILYKKDWLKWLVEVLDAFPEKKIYTTPIDYPTPKLKQKYWQGEIVYGKDTFKLSMRAGSNLWCMRREDFEKVGGFRFHRIAGSKWTDAATRAGYLACVIDKDLAVDMGLKKGYNMKLAIPIVRTLTDRTTKVYWNEDQFKNLNPDENYVNKRPLRL